MVVRKSTQVLFVFLLMIFLMVLGAGPAVAAPAMKSLPESGGAGVMGPPLQAGCGDGICDAYMGENASTCPQDCAATLVPVVSPTATSTRVVVTRTPTATPTATSTASATPTLTTEEASATPADVAAETPSASADGLVTLPGCDLAAYESRAQAWQKGYGGEASPGSFVPSRTDNREIYVCTMQPVGELCIPIYQGLISASQANMENIVLVDCLTSGSCQVHEGPGRQVGESICFDVTQADNLSCSAGCALAPKQTDVFVLPLFGNVPTRILAPTACLGALLVLGVVLGIVFVARRSRRREIPSPAASQAPSGWDVIPKSGGSS